MRAGLGAPPCGGAPTARFQITPCDGARAYAARELATTWSSQKVGKTRPIGAQRARALTAREIRSPCARRCTHSHETRSRRSARRCGACARVRCSCCPNMDRGSQLRTTCAGSKYWRAGRQDRGHGSVFLRVHRLQRLPACHGKAQTQFAHERPDRASAGLIQRRRGLADVSACLLCRPDPRNCRPHASRDLRCRLEDWRACDQRPLDAPSQEPATLTRRRCSLLCTPCRGKSRGVPRNSQIVRGRYE
jgi:hypothetical protein